MKLLKVRLMHGVEIEGQTVTTIIADRNVSEMVLEGLLITAKTKKGALIGIPLSNVVSLVWDDVVKAKTKKE